MATRPVASCGESLPVPGLAAALRLVSGTNRRLRADTDHRVPVGDATAGLLRWFCALASLRSLCDVAQTMARRSAQEFRAQCSVGSADDHVDLCSAGISAAVVVAMGRARTALLLGYYG